MSSPCGLPQMYIRRRGIPKCECFPVKSTEIFLKLTTFKLPGYKLCGLPEVRSYKVVQRITSTATVYPLLVHYHPHWTIIYLWKHWIIFTLSLFFLEFWLKIEENDEKVLNSIIVNIYMYSFQISGFAVISRVIFSQYIVVLPFSYFKQDYPGWLQGGLVQTKGDPWVTKNDPWVNQEDPREPDWLTYSISYWLIDWLIGWLIDWLTEKTDTRGGAVDLWSCFKWCHIFSPTPVQIPWLILLGSNLGLMVLCLNYSVIHFVLKDSRRIDAVLMLVFTCTGSWEP